MRWEIIKDVLLTGTGILVILSQVISQRPSDVLLVAGLALTVPSGVTHATALLSGRPPPSSPSSPPPGSSQPSSSLDGTEP